MYKQIVIGCQIQLDIIAPVYDVHRLVEDINEVLSNAGLESQPQILPTTVEIVETETTLDKAREIIIDNITGEVLDTDGLYDLLLLVPPDKLSKWVTENRPSK